jgi:hypothetical protein
MGDIGVWQVGDQDADDELISLIPREIFWVGNHHRSSRGSDRIHYQLSRRKNRAINEAIHILSSKICNELELTGHVIVLGQFDGRRVVHMWDIERRRLGGGTGISGNTRFDHWEEKGRSRKDEQMISLFVALILTKRILFE